MAKKGLEKSASTIEPEHAGKSDRLHDGKAKSEAGEGTGKAAVPMEHHNITEFLRGQSSKIFTEMAREDKAAYIQKNGKPLVVAISNDRYERLVRQGININEY